MHAHHIAHLDLSLRNLLTDGKGSFAYIDFETSRQFLPPPSSSSKSKGAPSPTRAPYAPRITEIRASEVPPELERGEASDPFKVDIWQLGMLMLNASKVRDLPSFYLTIQLTNVI